MFRPRERLRNVPPPPGSTAGKASAYTRFIPREELSSFELWAPGALGGDADEKAAPLTAAPSAAETAEQAREQQHAARQAGYQDGYRDGLAALEGFKQTYAAQMTAQVGTVVTAFQSQLDALQQQMAQALAATPARILILERGDFVPREAENWDPEAVWKHLRYRISERWLDEQGREFQPYTHYCVGGNTKFWGSVLYRLRREDFRAVEHADGISPAWPIDYETLEPYYDRAERLFHVEPGMGRRSIRRALYSAPKKTGKTGFIATIVAHHFFFGNEVNREIPLFAWDLEQTEYLYQAIQGLILRNELLTTWTRMHGSIGKRDIIFRDEKGTHVIRRIARDDRNQRRVGIQTLSKTAIPVRLARAGSTQTSFDVSREPQPAILLATAPDRNGEISVIMREGIFSARDGIEMAVGERSYLLQPARLIEGGEDFDWAAFRVKSNKRSRGS